MKYDYIIKNGTFVDFESGTTRQGDLYIKDGRIAEPAPGEEIDYEGLLDASGKYVVPGLVDEHAHYNYGIGHLGVSADMVCPSAGITTVVDAGSCGVENFDAFYHNDIYRYTTEVLAYCHISDYGVVATAIREEDQNPAGIQEKAIMDLFDRHPGVLRGLKVRMSVHTLAHGVEPLKAAVKLADRIEEKGHHCHVAVHAADLPAGFELNDILSVLRPGDVYTHLYNNQGPVLIDENGQIKDCFLKARERGVLFSSGHGGKHWCMDVMKQAFSQGFFPDIISSDIVGYNVYRRPGFNLLYSIASCMLCGMPAFDALKAVTEAPAKALGIYGEAGSLAPGSKADITILDLQDREISIIDRFGNEDRTKQFFVPLMTFREGAPVYRQIFFDGGRDFSLELKNYI